MRQKKTNRARRFAASALVGVASVAVLAIAPAVASAHSELGFKIHNKTPSNLYYNIAPHAGEHVWGQQSGLIVPGQVVETHYRSKGSTGSDTRVGLNLTLSGMDFHGTTGWFNNNWDPHSDRPNLGFQWGFTNSSSPTEATRYWLDVWTEHIGTDRKSQTIDVTRI